MNKYETGYKTAETASVITKTIFVSGTLDLPMNIRYSETSCAIYGADEGVPSSYSIIPSWSYGGIAIIM